MAARGISKLSPEQRSTRAKLAALARWAKAKLGGPETAPPTPKPDQVDSKDESDPSDWQAPEVAEKSDTENSAPPEVDNGPQPQAAVWRTEEQWKHFVKNDPFLREHYRHRRRAKWVDE